MANNVYIGARYVPKFDGDWSNIKSYEPLTIVKYGNNTYTSKRPVPVGTVPTNTDYWALTGNYNGQITELQNEVNNISALIGSGSLPNNEQTIIDALNWLNRQYEYIVWIGDSYTGASSLGSDIDKRYSTLVSQRLGLTEKNYAVGGSSFIGGNRNYQLQTDDAVDDFDNNSLDKSKVKYFIIGGTRNDGLILSSDISAYRSAINYVLNKAKNNFPNAEIIIFPMIWDASFMRADYLQTIERLKQTCEQNDAKVRIIDNCYTWLSGDWFKILYQNGANIHPNVAGHAVFAEKAYNAIMGSPYGISSAAGLGSTFWKSGFSGGHFDVFKYPNGLMHIHLQFKCDSVPADNYVGQASFNIADTCPELYIGAEKLWFNMCDRNGLGDAEVPVFLDCVLSRGGETSGTVQFTLRAYNGGLTAGHTYYKDITIPYGVLFNTNTIS